MVDTGVRTVEVALSPRSPNAMLGRDEELSELFEGMRTATGARLTAQLVIGEAGIGKTTLLTATLASLPTSVPVLICRADELDRGVPYSLFFDLCDRASALDFDAAPDSADLADILDLSRGLEAADYAFEAARWVKAFVRAGGYRLVVLAFEDVHNLDDSSLRFIGQLIRALRDAPIALLCTSRPGYDERTGPLRNLLTRMSRFAAGHVIELRAPDR